MNKISVTPSTVTTEGHPRKREIANKALQLFVAHGYEQTSIEDIARECDMSKGNFYHYFGSKEELIYLIQGDMGREQREEFAKLMQNMEGIGPKKALECFVQAYFHHVDRHQDAYNFLNHVVVQLGREGRHRLLQGSIDVYELFEKLILAGIAQGVFKDVHAKLVAHNIARIGSAWAHNRWHLRRFITIDEYIEEQLRYIFHGIETDRQVD